MTRLNFTFQETSPLITYSNWVEGSSSNDSFTSSYNGSFRVTFTDGATASLTFSGTAVSLFGATRANHGNYSVQLDQQPLFEAVGSTAQNVFNKSLWHADNLGYTEHTVVLTNIFTGTGHFLDLDYVSIERQIGQDGDHIFQTTLDDTSPAVQYLGSWERTTGRATAHQGTLHTTNVGNSQAVITFQGCCVELYGHYANALYSVALDKQRPVNMKGLNADLTPNFQHPQTLLYLIDGLTEGNHTVTLTNVESNVNRPFFFDYAVVSSTQNFTSNGTAPPKRIPSSPAASHERTPIGTIVGASIGGATLIAILMFLFIFIRRRHRHRADKAYPMDLLQELEPKPFVLPNGAESQHTYSTAALQRNSQDLGQFTHSMNPHQAAGYNSQSAFTSEDGLLSHQERQSTDVSGTYGARSSTATNGMMSSTSATRSASRPSRGSKAGQISRPHHVASESVEHPLVREEDAGVVVPMEDGSISGTLPPAYNPNWDRREE